MSHDGLPLPPSEPILPPTGPVKYTSDKNPFGTGRKARRAMNSLIRRAVKKARKR